MLNYYIEQFKAMLYVAPVILIAISFHEFAHGFVSYKMGDPTPKQDGRLTLNPLKHLDILGSLCLLFFHMGWAKPVRINTACYKNKKWGTVLVSLAGPCMNFILAFVSLLIYGLLAVYGDPYSNLIYIGGVLAYYSAVINIGLGLFNLIPFPPLDGSNVLGELWSGVNEIYRKFGPYRNLILIVLLVSGVLSRPLGIANEAMLEGMWRVVKMILSIGMTGNTGDVYI